MILTSESKLCVTLVLILALLAVMNMDTKSKPVANIGSVQNSTSSSVNQTATNKSNSSTVERMEQKGKGKDTKTPTVTTNLSSKGVTSKSVATTTTKSTKSTTSKVVKKAKAKTASVAKKVAKVAKKSVSKAKDDKKKFKASDYLPKQVNKKWWNTDFSVAKNKVNNKNLIPTQNYITGINTVASSLRLANHDLRARPANPQIVVSPWLNTTVAPDHNTKPLGI